MKRRKAGGGRRVLRSAHLSTQLALRAWLVSLVLLAGAIVLQFYFGWPAALAVCPLSLLALLGLSRRLLAPLAELRDGLRTCISCGGGNQVELSHLARNELWEAGQAFNQLSLDMCTRFRDMEADRAAYALLVPDSLLRLLGKKQVSALWAGETVQISTARLVLAPVGPGGSLEPGETLNRAVACIGTFGGAVVEQERGWGAITALFPDWEQAMDCAKVCERGEQPILTAVLAENTVLGVFGGERLLIPLTFAPQLARRFAVLRLLDAFGARSIRCGGEAKGLRLLGWDQGAAYYEDISWRPPDWQSGWLEACSLWEQGMELFRQKAFAPAMRRFGTVLRILPDDGAAHWYLFRCKNLRDNPQKEADIDLLYRWEGGL